MSGGVGVGSLIGRRTCGEGGGGEGGGGGGERAVYPKTGFQPVPSSPWLSNNQSVRLPFGQPALQFYLPEAVKTGPCNVQSTVKWAMNIVDHTSPLGKWPMKSACLTGKSAVPRLSDTSFLALCSLGQRNNEIRFCTFLLRFLAKPWRLTLSLPRVINLQFPL